MSVVSATSIELTEIYNVSKPAVLDLLHEHGLAKRKAASLQSSAKKPEP